MGVRFTLVGVGVCLVALAASSEFACNNADCNVNYNCPDTATCWSTNGGRTFECMSPGKAAFEDSCTPDLTRPPECGPGLACIQSASGTGGSCLDWCASPLNCSFETSGKGVCGSITINTTGAAADICQASP